MIGFDLFLPHGGLPGSVFTAIDILREINSLARARAGRRVDPPVAWRVLDADGKPHPMRRAAYLNVDESRRARAAPATRVFVVAPMMMVTIPGLRRLVAQNAALGAQLRAAHDRGDWIASCGTGLWILARAGLLQHQPAPLPWLYQSGFAKDFPETPISSETPLVVGPHMVLAGAPNLVFEMMLKLLDGVGLSDLSSACRDKLVNNPERQHLILNIPEQVVGTSRDAPLHRALAFIESNAGRPLTVGDMASAAAVSERTLLRLFDRHIERSPLQFLHELRVKRAKMWLEATWRSVNEIAESSGYADVSTFRRTFKRIAGMSPSEYRLRYTIRTPRAVWQLQALEEVPSSTADSRNLSAGKRRPVDRG